MAAKSKATGRARDGHRIYIALVSIDCGNLRAPAHTIAQGERFTRRMQPGGGKARSYPFCSRCLPFE